MKKDPTISTNNATTIFDGRLKDEKANSTRVIAVLGSILYIVYTIMDYFGLPKEALAILIPLRALTILIFFGIYSLTYKDFFQTHYNKIQLFGFYWSALTICIGIFLSKSGEYSYDFYFVTLIILIICAFSWTYLPIRQSLTLSLVIIIAYAALRTFHHQEIAEGRALTLASHLYFLVSVVVIASIAQYIRDNLLYKNIRLQEELKRTLKAKTKEAKKQQQLANMDTLTGIPNRRYIMESIREAISKAEQKNTLITLIFIDLDGFKKINDTYGHDSGDKVLEITAKRLSQTIRKEDFLARLGGDEFLIAFETNHFSTTFIDHLCAKIKKNISAPIAFNGNKFNVGTSTGVSNYPVDGKTVEELIKVADQKMYFDKQERKAHNLRKLNKKSVIS